MELCERQPATVAVAIETPHGVLVDALLEHGFAVFAINPKQLDRFRDRFTVAGAKDDRRDAWSSPRLCAPTRRRSAGSSRRIP